MNTLITQGNTLARARFTQAPSREEGVTYGSKPDGTEKLITPSDDLDSFDSYWFGEDQDAGKFEVKTMELTPEGREALKENAKRSLASVAGGAMGGTTGVLLSMMNEDIDQAKTVAFEVPKKGEEPQRSPEVWLLADNKR